MAAKSVEHSAQSTSMQSDAAPSPFLNHYTSVELLANHRYTSDQAPGAAQASTAPVWKKFEPPSNATALSAKPMTLNQEVSIMEAIHSSGDTNSLQVRSKNAPKNQETITFNTTSNERSVDLTASGDGAPAQEVDGPHATPSPRSKGTPHHYQVPHSLSPKVCICVGPTHVRTYTAMNFRSVASIGVF